MGDAETEAARSGDESGAPAAPPKRAVRAKVCGLTRPDDVDAAVTAGADAVGAIVDVPVETPREVSVERARELFAAAPPLVTAVLVTFPDGADELAAAVDPDAVQLHGELSADELADLREAIDRPVVKTVAAGDRERAAAYDGVADALLVDSTDADGGGGTGRTHDWSVTADIVDAVDAPVLLAGGLTPDNVAEAVRTVRPFAVDVASGVETVPGEKDHGAIGRFVDAATAAGRDAGTAEVSP